MDDVKKKVFLDLFASPITLLPVVAGATALLASWAFGGVAALTMGGIVGVLGGIGMFATRIIFGLDKLTNRAYEYVVQKQQEDQRKALEELYNKLQGDNDPRTERLLGQLWDLYSELKKDVDDGKVTMAAHEVLDGVDNNFKVCVDYLDRSHRTLVTAKRMKGTARDEVLMQREKLIEEVANSCIHLEKTIGKLNTASTERKTSELSQMRSELDETIRVAKRAEERAGTLGQEEDRPYDISEFE